jgi:hypothetical protein
MLRVGASQLPSFDSFERTTIGPSPHSLRLGDHQTLAFRNAKHPNIEGFPTKVSDDA